MHYNVAVVLFDSYGEMMGGNDIAIVTHDVLDATAKMAQKIANEKNKTEDLGRHIVMITIVQE